MADLAELAHDVITCRMRAALCRDMGEHGLAEHLERKADDAQAAIERIDLGAVTERAVVTECGVS